MNIFYLDKDLKKSSEYLVDKHICKQILEHCQMLSTAKRLTDGKLTKIEKKSFYLLEQETIVITENGKPKINNPVCYRQTHANHPSAVWVRESLTNYNWLIEYTEYMLKEYTYRYNKIHKIESSGILEYLKSNPPNIPDIGFTPFALAMPNEYKSDNPVLSYRMYYIKNKNHLAKWKNRLIPYWYDYF